MASFSSAASCPRPFLDQANFPSDHGWVAGRVCSTIPGSNVSCCLPCPSTDWVYPDSFYTLTRIPGFIAIGSLALCVFMLISFIVLPLEKTRRHYLNVCLVLGIILLELGFIVPVLNRPARCVNAITPYDWRDSMVCAWGGGLIVAGGCAINAWVLVRAFSMHLQICWDVIPGRKFFYASQVFAWGLTGLLTAVEMTFTGVSFRFGDYCHVNHLDSLATLWGPLLGLASLTAALQFSTFAYCLKVYLKSLGDQRPDTGYSGGGGPPSSSASVATPTPFAAWRRIIKVLKIQWRALVIVTVVLIDLVYFSIVFIILDGKITRALSNIDNVMPWVVCMIETDDKNKCLDLTGPFTAKESTLIATLVLLCIVGILAFVLVGRWHMVTGWFDLIGDLFQHKRAKSSHSRQLSENRQIYQLLKVSTPITMVGSPDADSLKSPPCTYSPQRRHSPVEASSKHTSRPYHSPNMSFSRPVPNLRSFSSDSKGWDPESTFAPPSNGFGVPPFDQYSSMRGWI